MLYVALQSKLSQTQARTFWYAAPALGPSLLRALSLGCQLDLLEPAPAVGEGVQLAVGSAVSGGVALIPSGVGLRRLGCCKG